MSPNRRAHAHLGDREGMAEVQQAVHVGVGEVAKELVIGRALSCRGGSKQLPLGSLVLSA